MAELVYVSVSRRRVSDIVSGRKDFADSDRRLSECVWGVPGTQEAQKSTTTFADFPASQLFQRVVWRGRLLYAKLVKHGRQLLEGGYL